MRWIPNALSAFRLIAAPAMVTVALFGLRDPFLWLLAASLTSDALDGFAARALGIESDLGRRLDSWGDYLTIAAVVPGLWLLWPALMRQEGWWLCAGVSCFFMPVVVGLIRSGKAPGYHTIASKAVAVLMAPALFFLLLDVASLPFHVGVALQGLVMLEEFAIMWRLPGHSGSVPTYWSIKRPPAE